MSTSLRLTVSLALCLAIAGCINKEETTVHTGPDETASMTSSNVSNKAILGTWQGRETEGGNAAATQPAGFQFASVSFVGDGTFTAQMRYKGQLVADSGTWKLNGNTLTVQGSAGASSHGGAAPHGDASAHADPHASGHATGGSAPSHGSQHGGPRTYMAETRGSELMITDPKTEVTVILDRMKNRT